MSVKKNIERADNSNKKEINGNQYNNLDNIGRRRVN